jgi:hypothetical protein
MFSIFQARRGEAMLTFFFCVSMRQFSPGDKRTLAATWTISMLQCFHEYHVMLSMTIQGLLYLPFKTPCIAN